MSQPEEARWPLASNEKRSGILQNILPCTAHPSTTKNQLIQCRNCSRVRTSLSLVCTLMHLTLHPGVQVLPGYFRTLGMVAVAIHGVFLALYLLDDGRAAVSNPL